MLPLVNRTAKAMSMWLAPAWGGGLELRPDLDAIEALSSERDQLWARLEKTGFLTQDEKRAAAGYGAIGSGGDSSKSAAKFNHYHDELGRFTTADGASASGFATS